MTSESATKTAWDIYLENLSIGYGENIVLNNINAILPGGKISVILGGSGCGKSTLLRHIVGLKAPISGKIILGGHDMFALPKSTFRRIRRRMGMLFQDGALLGSLTLGENVGLPLKEHTKISDSIIYDAVNSKLALVGLENFYAYYPNQLSGGMRKRAGLARALITEPPILLCDEPTSGLDPINSAQMDTLLLDMKARLPNMTIVVVSHDLQSLYAIADHVLVLNEGKAAFNGPLSELEHTKDPYLRRFLDREAVNMDSKREANYELSAESQGVIQKSLDAWLGNI